MREIQSSLRVLPAKIVTDPSYRDSAVHCTTPVQSIRPLCARGAVCARVCVHRCARVSTSRRISDRDAARLRVLPRPPGTRYCNFKDRSGTADRYFDPKYRFSPRRRVPRRFARVSSRSTRSSAVKRKRRLWPVSFTIM